MFIKALTSPRKIGNQLFFSFFFVQKFSFDQVKKKKKIMSRFYFGFIVMLLVLGVMLPEYTTIKMKLFSVSQWKFDDVFPIFSTVQWTLFEVDLS